MKTFSHRSPNSMLLTGRNLVLAAALALIPIALVSLGSSVAAQPQRFEERVIARLVEARGDSDFQEPGRDWRDAHSGMELPPEFDFRTRRGAEATLQFADGQRITVGDESLLQVRSSRDRGRISRIEVTLTAGVLHAQSENYAAMRADFDVNTPNLRIDVQGAEFAVRYDARRQTTRVSVSDGSLEVEPMNRSFRPVRIARGQTFELTPSGINPFRGDFDRWDEDRPPVGQQPYPSQPFIPGGGAGGGVCIAEGSGPASPNRDEHFRFAREHNPQELEVNVRMKLEMLFRCNLVSEPQLANYFADISVLVGRNAPNPGCFNGDRGSTGTDRRKHFDWARDKGRQAMLENIEWKVSAALHCMDRDRQDSFFADVSVVIAQGRVRM
jgi:hypothetical protein